MRYTVLALAVGYMLLIAVTAQAAGAGACYSINDADARTYCLAKAHHEPTQCYAVQNADMRAWCLAEVRK